MKLLSNKKPCYSLKCSYCGRFIARDDLLNKTAFWEMTFNSYGEETYEGECKSCRQKDECK